MEADSVDSTGHPPRRLPEVSSPALRAIIQELDSRETADESGPYSAASIAAAARRICIAARSDTLLIEQAIVCVKEAWRTTPGRLKPRTGASDAVLDQLVSACIREFYTER